MNERVKALSAGVGCVGVGLFLAARLILAKAPPIARLQSPPWIGYTEWLALVGLAVFVVGVAGWLVLDALDHGIADDFTL